jgi:glycosyltransferase involved in cell wall biosynthesis
VYLPVRIAVFNGHWATAGGGEKYAGSFAQALSGIHDVEILAETSVDVESLKERLRLDLSDCRVRLTEEPLAEASNSFDLLINCSYGSADASGARHGLYVVHFPMSVIGRRPRWQQAASALAGYLATKRLWFEWSTGFYPRERGRLGYRTWTSGTGRLNVFAPQGETIPLHVTFGDARPPSLPPATVRVRVDGIVRAELLVGGHRAVTAVAPVTGHGVVEPAEIVIESDTFVPHEVTGSADSRRLGVMIRSIRLGGHTKAAVEKLLPNVDSHTAPAFLKTYDLLVANSLYTRSWVQRWWHLDSAVLYPPASAIPSLEKERLILNVGRFFPPASGHSKKQLEMVRAFRMLCDRGLHGWTLHLAGGCKEGEHGYLRSVQEEALGLPIVLHANATGTELAGLYGRAAIYWHATGLGERELTHPDRFEHFGITVIEAMTAGAVPVVMGRGGPRETVVHGVSGLHFEDLDELVRHTWMLVERPNELARLRAGARRRAEHFNFKRFADELEVIIARLAQ